MQKKHLKRIHDILHLAAEQELDTEEVSDVRTWKTGYVWCDHLPADITTLYLVGEPGDVRVTLGVNSTSTLFVVCDGEGGRPYVLHYLGRSENAAVSVWLDQVRFLYGIELPQ